MFLKKPTLAQIANKINPKRKQIVERILFSEKNFSEEERNGLVNDPIFSLEDLAFLSKVFTVYYNAKLIFLENQTRQTIEEIRGSGLHCQSDNEEQDLQCKFGDVSGELLGGKKQSLENTSGA